MIDICVYFDSESADLASEVLHQLLARGVRAVTSPDPLPARVMVIIGSPALDTVERGTVILPIHPDQGWLAGLIGEDAIEHTINAVITLLNVGHFKRSIEPELLTEAAQDIDRLFEHLQTAGRTLTPDLIYQVVALTNELSGESYTIESAQIYLRAAKGLLDLLPQLPSRQPSLLRVINALPALVQTGDERLIDDASALAGELQAAFAGLAGLASEERSWEFDS